MERIKERKQEKESHENEQTRKIMNQKYTNIKSEEKSQKKHLKTQIQNAEKQQKENEVKFQRGITLIALVITIVLNSSYLAMERMNKIEKI